MQTDAVIELARDGRLYPALILHGGSLEDRRRAATELARTLLCERPAESRPCGECRHCRRIDAAESGAASIPTSRCSSETCAP